MFFFFNDTATTEIYTLSLHDALPICLDAGGGRMAFHEAHCGHELKPHGNSPRHRSHRWHELGVQRRVLPAHQSGRSEEHTSELQSLTNLVCRLLLEKKKQHGARSDHT